jgi:hypothetical protein
MQGFLFAKPAPAATIDRLLSQQKQNSGAKPLPPQAATLTA